MKNTPLTEAHYTLRRDVIFSAPDDGAHLIADSEARACDQLRAEVEQWELAFQEQYARAESAEREVERLEAKISNQADRIRWLEGATNHATGTPLSQAIARAERAEAELGKLQGFYNEIVAECGHDLIVREYRQRGELLRDEANRRKEAEAELATERARMADLVADLNDACITLESAKNDCDDYAMQNTAFKLMAVSNVLLQYIPYAAMEEGVK